MATQHLKSACCRALIIKYGGKRRQCVICKRTWTVRPQKRGRKRLRITPRLIERYFSGSIPTIQTLQKRFGWGRERAQQMMRRSLIQYIKNHQQDWTALLPKQGRLIAVADAIWHWINREKFTTYLILLRPLDRTEAVIMPPVFVSGHEDRRGWEHAWAQVPTAYQRRICALICDGQWWLISFGYRKRWVVQRCHFHLLANLLMYLGVSDRQRNSKVLMLVRSLLTTANLAQSRRLLTRLARLRRPAISRGVIRVLSGLATNYQDFQSYLRYPQLNLPTTTNAAESCISGIKELLRRCRGLRNRESLQLWLTGYLLWKRTIRCNGKYQQK